MTIRHLKEGANTPSFFCRKKGMPEGIPNCQYLTIKLEYYSSAASAPVPASALESVVVVVSAEPELINA